MITIRRMAPSEVGRIHEIDRTEHVSQVYTILNGRLVLVDIDWRIGKWDAAEKIRDWTPIVDGWRNFWGAFDGDTLVGFTVYRAQLTEDTAQLAILHVSHGYRKRGIGTQLAAQVVAQARNDGAKKLYVTATRSRSTTEFYQRLGFSLAEQINEELYRIEPHDIHMIMELC